MSEKGIFRRDFLKWAVLGTVGAAAEHFLGKVIPPTPPTRGPVAALSQEVPLGNESGTQRDYTVNIEPTDNLSRIVTNYNSQHATNYSWQEIADFNRILNPRIIHPGEQIIFPVEQRRESSGVGFLYFGPFWEYTVNPAQDVAAELASQNRIKGADYQELTVDYSKAVAQVREYVLQTNERIIVVLAASGSEDMTYIETSAGNRWPDPLPIGYDDPYNISSDMVPIYPDEPLHRVRRIADPVRQEMQGFIDDNGWQNVQLADNGPYEGFNTPCNATYYALLRECASRGKTGVLIHLPMNRELARDASPKISNIVQDLANFTG